MATPSADYFDFRLDAHRGEHRLLLVFAPSDRTEEKLAIQMEYLDGHEDGFQERELLLLTLTGTDEGGLQETPGADAKVLTEGSIRRLRDRFDVPEDAFRVILVGKEGIEKRRDAVPVAARSVFDSIDATPTRQKEIRTSLEEE